LLLSTIETRRKKVFDILTGSMSGAQIGTRGALTALAFITFEALAFTRFTVTDSLARTLCILMSLAHGVGSIYPCQLKWANAIRAVTRIHGKTHSPVIKTLADIVKKTLSMA
jgi:hypothetical protein